MPLVADMSSMILSQPIDVTKFGVIYAGTQKNLGPAGMCVVVVRRDLMGHARTDTPTILEYSGMAANDSMLRPLRKTVHSSASSSISLATPASH